VVHQKKNAQTVQFSNPNLFPGLKDERSVELINSSVYSMA